MMCRRANEREAFGGPLAEKQFVQESIATSRMEIDQARLLTLYAAWKMDTEGKRAARQSISAIKIVAANMVMDVLDRAIQVHGSPRHDRRHPARRALALQPHAAPRRRPRRGPQDGPRPPRAEPLAKRAEAEATAPSSPDTRRAWSEPRSIDSSKPRSSNGRDARPFEAECLVWNKIAVRPERRRSDWLSANSISVLLSNPRLPETNAVVPTSHTANSSPLFRPSRARSKVVSSNQPSFVPPLLSYSWTSIVND